MVVDDIRCQEAGDNDARDALDRQLPENCVEYFLFLLDKGDSTEKQLLDLGELQKQAENLVQDIAQDYLWQRDGFELELEVDKGIHYLHGRTEYGDAVDDEWLIVYVLRELTKSYPTLWARVVDADGEFLLIEAASVLPEWLRPGMDQNRVWLHDGHLFIIPLRDDDADNAENQSVTISQAVEFLLDDRSLLVHCLSVQNEALYRLRKYPGQIADSAHNSLVSIPRRLAHVIHSFPKSVSLAVEAFYLRDPLSLSPIMSSSASLAFPPEDLVTTSVRFSKVLFAQLKSQHLEPPSKWQNVLRRVSLSESADVDQKIARIESGMKLTCGYEMLTASLNKERGNETRFQTAQVIAGLLDRMIKCGPAMLPTDEEMSLWQDSHRDDDETWMDIDFRDLERELDGKPASGNKTAFGNTQTQADLRKIVSRFESFLNDDSAGLDGADPGEEEDDHSSDDDDNESEGMIVSFDEHAFSRMMREIMGLPTTNPQTAVDNQGEDRIETPKTKSSDSNQESFQIEEMAQHMEAELKHLGALNCDDPDSHAALKIKDPAVESKHGPGSANQMSETQHHDDPDEVDVDFNLAINILESFKSQGGMPGPTGNLLGMMGFQLPRDDNEADETSPRDTP